MINAPELIGPDSSRAINISKKRYDPCQGHSDATIDPGAAEADKADQASPPAPQSENLIWNKLDSRVIARAD